MIKKGIYAASLSVLNENGTLNINETILHAESAIRSGLHGVFFFGSTGQSQLISINEKKEFIAKIASHKLRKQFFLGTGCNSLNDNSDLIKYAMEYNFRDFLIIILPKLFYLSYIIKFKNESFSNSTKNWYGRYGNLFTLYSRHIEKVSNPCVDFSEKKLSCKSTAS